MMNESRISLMKKNMITYMYSGLKIIVQNKRLLIGLCMIIGIYLVALIGSIVWPYEPKKTGDVSVNLPPSLAHPLGSDSLGRDILAQLFHGTINSMYIGFSAGSVAFIAVTLLGLIGAYFRGILDSVICVITEVFYTIPSLAILIIIAAVFGSVTIEYMILILAAFSGHFQPKY